MKPVFDAFAIAIILIGAATAAAGASTLEGVITSYVSGNEGTNMTLRTSDGKSHTFWFDNMKKPTFQGAQLPWCPSFPCAGWPAKLVLNKTRVVVTFMTARVSGAVVEEPTKLSLAP